MLAAMGHAPYSELKSLVDAHIHRAQWFQVDHRDAYILHSYM